MYLISYAYESVAWRISPTFNTRIPKQSRYSYLRPCKTQSGNLIKNIASNWSVLEEELDRCSHKEESSNLWRLLENLLGKTKQKPNSMSNSTTRSTPTLTKYLLVNSQKQSTLNLTETYATNAQTVHLNLTTSSSFPSVQSKLFPLETSSDRASSLGLKTSPPRDMTLLLC